jgi:agmatinase
MKGVFNNTFIGARETGEAAAVTLLGCPLDATSSFRPGTRFAPESIRKASWTLETYSPYFKGDLEDMAFGDAGDLPLRQGDLTYALDIIEQAATGAYNAGGKMLVLGGEHLVTYPIMKAVKKRFGGVQVVHFDAHCDMRDDYEGQKLSHATVMRRVAEIGIPEVLHVGIRSGTRQEFEGLISVESPASLLTRLRADMPVYVTFDMDVFDPSLVPGVTTPEPGGLMFKEAVEYLLALEGLNVIGADVVELAPDYDTTFVSSVCAAKVAREILMLLCR